MSTVANIGKVLRMIPMRIKAPSGRAAIKLLAESVLCIGIILGAHTVAADPLTRPGAAGASELKLNLDAEETSEAEGRTLRLRASLINPSATDVEVTTYDADPPLLLQVWNATGEVVFSTPMARAKINRADGLPSTSNRTFDVLARGENNWQLTMGCPPFDTSAEPLPDGNYEIQVTLPMVSYLDGKYSVDLLKSNVLKIAIALGDRYAGPKQH